MNGRPRLGARQARPRLEQLENRLAPAVTLAPIFQDGMVLQRDMPIHVWGSALPGEAIDVRLANQEASTQADASGKWSVDLAALHAGGPLTLEVAGQNRISL